MHRVLITTQQKCLYVERVDIFLLCSETQMWLNHEFMWLLLDWYEHPGLSLGCPSSPLGPPESEGPTAFSCSFFLTGVWLQLLSPLCPPARLSSGFTCLSVCVREVQQDLSMVILHHLRSRVSLWPQSVLSSKTGPAADHYTCKHLTPACARLSQTAPWIMPGVVDLGPTESGLQGPGFHQRGDVLILEGLCGGIPALWVWTYVLSATNLPHLLFT